MKPGASFPPRCVILSDSLSTLSLTLFLWVMGTTLKSCHRGVVWSPEAHHCEGREGGGEPRPGASCALQRGRLLFLCVFEKEFLPIMFLISQLPKGYNYSNRINVC